MYNLTTVKGVRKNLAKKYADKMATVFKKI